jgi:hypothetical protein
MKRYFILLILLIVLAIFGQSYYYKTKAGTTTNDYVVADSLVTHIAEDYSFIIKNLGTDPPRLTCKARGYFGSWASGIYEDIIIDPEFYETEVIVTDGGVHMFSGTDLYYGIKVLVKSTVADSATTYRLYMAQKR